jgi:hypothetical protein
MKRQTAIAIAQVTALMLALLAIVASMLAGMMRPSSSLIDNLRLAGAVVAIVTTVAVLMSLRSVSTRLQVAAIALTLLAGILPSAVEQAIRYQEEQAERAETRTLETRLIADLDARKRDVEARIALRRPYAPQDALDFVTLSVRGTDLSYRSGADRSDAALAILQRALEGKLVDPNAMVKGPRPVDTAPEPLFIHFYKAWVPRKPDRLVDALSWRAMKLLAANGADLSLPEAVPLVEDLRKTEKPAFGRYFELN